MKRDPFKLYTEYFVQRDFERQGLFELLAQTYKIKRALYPGSYVHVTPSFVFPVTTYIDSDKPAARFFSNPGLVEFVSERKLYTETPTLNFYPADYREPVPERAGTYDLLISQYAGFVSQPCKRYLRTGGILVANDSHGDAAMAHLDPDYEFIAAISRGNRKYKLDTGSLEQYFMPKQKRIFTRRDFELAQKGVTYTKSADNYVFRRVH